MEDSRTTGNKYLKIKSTVDFTELERIKTFPILNLGRYQGGLIAEERFSRKKPFGSLCLLYTSPSPRDRG